MTKLRKKDCESMHRDLWNYIHDNLKKLEFPISGWGQLFDLKEKWEGFEKLNVDFQDYNYCFACYFCNTDCVKCPIHWTDNKPPNEKEDEDEFNYFYDAQCETQFDSPYHKLLLNSNDLKTAKKYAKQIANMEWKAKK